MTARRRPTGDAGTSLMELVVGMTLMGVFMAMFTAAVVGMTSAANKVEVVTVSAAQVNQAFLQLDKVVRYASAISTPGKAAGGTGDWYVELSTPSTGGGATCIQLRDDVSSQQLQQRSWPVSAAGVAGPYSGWTPLASSITNTATNVPFVLATPSGSLFQQLQVSLMSSSISPATATSNMSATFTALNSTPAAPSACQQGGRA